MRRMNLLPRTSSRQLVTCLLSLGSFQASPQLPTVEPFSRQVSTDLAAAITHAAADQLFAVHLELGQPTSIGELRTLATELRVPRVLAYVEFPRSGSPVPGLTILGLGEMYAATAATQYSECRALVAVTLGSSQLQGSPIDTWPSRKIHVYATAHVIRELASSRRLTSVTILDGGTAELAHLDSVAQAIRNEAAQPISKPSNIELPSYCAQFVGTTDAPILTGELPPDLEARRSGATFREDIVRTLASLPPGAAVTITLKLDYPADVEALAALVEQYEISGMQAELVPQRSSQRVIADAQLSIFGAGLQAQIHRVRCQMRLGAEEPQASSEWFADWVSVSLSTEAAARFLSYPRIAQASLAGVYSASDLQRLRGYHERLAARVYEMPTSIQIPPDCGDVYVHNAQTERGRISFRPE